MNTLFRILGFPFTLLYGLLTDVRNWLYDNDFKKITNFPVFIINVGNITVGGTGKTPMVEYLINLLKNQTKIATISRGYGRKSKGFIQANEQATAETIGDEPMQFFTKFGKEITVCVGEDRVGSAQKLLIQSADIQTIILDDAYQHRGIGRNLNILLMDYNRPIYQDYPFPVGRLRERRHGAKRADCVVVTKCPDGLSRREQEGIIEKLKPYLKIGMPVFFAGILYGGDNLLITQSSKLKAVLITGIAQTTPLLNHLKDKVHITNHLSFQDHHSYTKKDWQHILENFDKMKNLHLPWSVSSPTTSTELVVGEDTDHGKGTQEEKYKIILTTEKDYMKLKAFATPEIPLFYLPIELYFLNDYEQAFQKWILAKFKNS